MTGNVRSVRMLRPRFSKAALRPALKRALDVAGAVLLLLPAAPAFVLVYLLVRADGGPAFAARPRVGRGGSEFGLLAFRIPEAAGAGGGRGARDYGAYPTRFGRVLRWTGLDEIPQLLNVLRGDMSLVGPRAATQEELRRSHALFGGEATYLSVRPGLTGPHYIYGPAGVRERIALEAAYAQNPSLRADLAILARTLGMVLRGTEIL